MMDQIRKETRNENTYHLSTGSSDRSDPTARGVGPAATVRSGEDSGTPTNCGIHTLLKRR